MTGYTVSVCCRRPRPDQLFDVASDFRHPCIRQQPERREPIVAARHDLLARVPTQNTRNVRGTETLTDARDARQDFSRKQNGFRSRLQFAQAVVTRAAILLPEPIAEVLGEVTVAAPDARCIALHLTEQGAGCVGQLAILLEHRAPSHEVGRRIDQQTLGLEPVTAGASRLLLVMLERSRRSRVNDEPHVRAVDAHAERHGRDDDVRALAQERILMAGAVVIRKTGVIRQRCDAGLRQPRSKSIHFAARGAINDSRLAPVSRQHIEQLLLQGGARERPIGQIGTIERSHELEWLVETELRGDIAPDASGRGGGVRVQADARAALVADGRAGGTRA